MAAIKTEGGLGSSLGAFTFPAANAANEVKAPSDGLYEELQLQIIYRF